MPAPIQRDPDQTRAAIAEWLAQRFPDAGEIVVTDFHAPPSSGFSGETLLVDTVWAGEERPLVIRVAPTTYTDNTTSMRADGNNVDIDNEMSLLAQNNVRYNALVQLSAKKMSMLQYVISGGGR